MNYQADRSVKLAFLEKRNSRRYSPILRPLFTDPDFLSGRHLCVDNDNYPCSEMLTGILSMF